MEFSKFKQKAFLETKLEQSKNREKLYDLQNTEFGKARSKVL
jgi:hypothetical protein